MYLCAFLCFPLSILCIKNIAAQEVVCRLADISYIMCSVILPLI